MSAQSHIEYYIMGTKLHYTALCNNKIVAVNAEQSALS
jgi:hypothetical protein